jgi:hypothetical protein
LPPVPHHDIQTCSHKINDEDSWAFSEIDIDSTCFPVIRNVHQKSIQWKQRVIKDFKTPNTEFADKVKAKGISAKTVIPHCVRQELNFEDNAVVRVGCSRNQDKYKAFNEQIKLKTPWKKPQNSNRCGDFPCNYISILLSLILMFPIVIHISLFIFLFQC